MIPWALLSLSLATVIPAEHLSDAARQGQLLYARKGCNACHSTDGSPGIGPTFKDLYGSTLDLASGQSVLVTQAHLRESITNPSAILTPGYDNQMPAFDLREHEISALVVYIRTLSTADLHEQLQLPPYVGMPYCFVYEPSFLEDLTPDVTANLGIAAFSTLALATAAPLLQRRRH